MSSRGYNDAVTALNSLQSNSAVLDALRASGGRSSEFAIPEMLEYLNGIGYQPEDLDKLNVIHVTGTKGKGSTSAFTESIIRHAIPGVKTGLYTSPHLIAVRERIRINGAPLSEEDFAKYFFQVWDRLENDFAPAFDTTPAKPGYFRFMTLLAFHVFTKLKVDATILEVGVGGTYDSTNIVPKPLVTGITALGLDHVNVLGKTIGEIAWQKGGIFKSGVPAFTVNQPEEGMRILRERAVELKSSTFTVIPEIRDIVNVRLGLAGAHQLQNAHLAVSLAKSFLEQRTGHSIDEALPDAFIAGLTAAKWPGRCQVVHDPATSNLTWYLDGAHTLESLECCMRWFVSPGVGIASTEKSHPTSRVLVFNCTNGRSGANFLAAIYRHITTRLELFGANETGETFFDQVIFCTNVTYADGGFKGDLTAVALPPDDLAALRTQNQLADAWKALVPTYPQQQIHVLPSIEHAVTLVRGLNNPVSPTDVLVTGSLHLVGGMIEAANLSDIAL